MSFQENLDVLLERQAKIKKIKLWVALIIGTPAWVILFTIDWKIQVCLFFIILANNLSNNS